MDSFASVRGLATISNPSVLIIEPHSTLSRLRQEWRETMPDITFDVCVPGEAGPSKQRQGLYHTVISDTTLIDADPNGTR
jgi:hypothetical protein